VVVFGSQVTILRDDDRRETFRIVGEDEADPGSGSNGDAGSEPDGI
jgi:transcription elongation GreA/GreB family factor